jgi:hypothetical protein
MKNYIEIRSIISILYLNSMSLGSTFSALASLRMVTNWGLRSPLSNLQIALAVTPDSRDRSAWLMTFLILSSFSVAMWIFQHKITLLSIFG